MCEDQERFVSRWIPSNLNVDVDVDVDVDVEEIRAQTNNCLYARS